MFLTYISEMQGASRVAALEEAKKIVAKYQETKVNTTNIFRQRYRHIHGIKWIDVHTTHSVCSCPFLSHWMSMLGFLGGGGFRCECRISCGIEERIQT